MMSGKAKTFVGGRARQTFNEGEFSLEDLFKLSFGNPVPVEEYAFGGLVGFLLLEVRPVVDELCDQVLWDNKSVKRHDY